MKLFLLFLLFIVSINARSFGYNKDGRFANMLWNQMNQMNLVGSQSIFTHPYKGLPPHGTYVEMIESKLSVGRTRGHVIILKNYMSSHINIMHIINNPSAYLKNISVMFKRKNGYDRDNKNWFYVQYDASGMVMTSIQGFKLAGKIAKGSTRGCISCHMMAPGGDYVFSHDKLASLKEPKMYKIRDNKKMRMSSMGTEDTMNKMSKPHMPAPSGKNTMMHGMEPMMFGKTDDIMYAKHLWANMQKSELNSKPSNLYAGGKPHGKIREVLEGKINGKRVLVKRNYAGEGVQLESVARNRAKYLKSITVMAKRNRGYDMENSDWFWAKYKADGSLYENEKNMKLAGKITDCIKCHLSAPRNTFVFNHSKIENGDIMFVKDFVSQQ